MPEHGMAGHGIPFPILIIALSKPSSWSSPSKASWLGSLLPAPFSWLLSLLPNKWVGKKCGKGWPRKSHSSLFTRTKWTAAVLPCSFGNPKLFPSRLLSSLLLLLILHNILSFFFIFFCSAAAAVQTLLDTAFVALTEWMSERILSSLCLLVFLWASMPCHNSSVFFVSLFCATITITAAKEGKKGSVRDKTVENETEE